MPPSKKIKSVAAALAPSASNADQANSDPSFISSAGAEDGSQSEGSSQPVVVLPTEPAAAEPQLPGRIEGDPGPELTLPAELAQPVDGESLADLVSKLAAGRLELPALPGHVSQVGEGVQLDGSHQDDGSLLQPAASPGHVRVRALRQVEHDGRLYGPDQIAGDEINMPAAQADALQPTGAIERM